MCLVVMMGCASSDINPTERDLKLVNTLLDMAEASNCHDLERELSFYTDDAKFEIVGEGGFIIEGKEELHKLFARDALLNCRLTLTDFHIQSKTVITHRVKEQNDFFAAIGLDAIYYGKIRETFRGGLIHEVRAELSPESIKALENQGNAFHEWITKNNNPDELRTLEKIEKGEITPANKDKCLGLIRQWQQAIKGAV
jgi:hypothetical protein